MKIVNLTQHEATREQIEAGVFEPVEKELIKKLLTFTELPIIDELCDRAERLADIALENGADAAMIGGAPYLMILLHDTLVGRDIQPLYAFSERVSVEKEEGGKIIKTSVFKHVGFVGLE